MSCGRGPALRRRWAEFPLVRAGDGKSDIPDKRRPEGRHSSGLFDSEEREGRVLRTAIQTIRCMGSGGYCAEVVEGKLRVRGAIEMEAGLRESVKDNRDEIIELLETYCGGKWPPIPGSAIHGYEEIALKVLEIREKAA